MLYNTRPDCISKTCAFARSAPSSETTTPMVEAKTSQSPTTFFDLPPEIRNSIYRIICQQIIIFAPDSDMTGSDCTMYIGDCPRTQPLAMLKVNRQIHDEFLGTLLSHGIVFDLRGHNFAEDSLVAVVSAGPSRKFLDNSIILRFGERYRTPFEIGVTIHSWASDGTDELDPASMINLIRCTLDKLCTKHDDFMFWEFLMAIDRIMIMEFAV